MSSENKSHDGDDQEDRAREELRSQVESAMASAGTILGKSKEIEIESNQIIDYGQLYLGAIDHLRPDRLEEEIHIWGLTNNSLSILESNISDLSPIFASTSGTVNASLYPLTKTGGYVFDEDDLEKVNQLVVGFKDLQDVEAEYTKVRKLIDQNNLDNHHEGELPPSDLLEIAFSAYEAPVSSDPVPANTSIIPAREAIHTLLDNLIAKRPTQEKVKGQAGKVRSVFNQLIADEVDAAYIDIFAKNWESLNRNELSGNKRGDLTREEWRRILFKALSLINSMLGAIDKTKYKV